MKFSNHDIKTDLLHADFDEHVNTFTQKMPLLFILYYYVTPVSKYNRKKIFKSN